MRKSSPAIEYYRENLGRTLQEMGEFSFAEQDHYYQQNRIKQHIQGHVFLLSGFSSIQPHKSQQSALNHYLPRQTFTQAHTHTHHQLLPNTHFPHVRKIVYYIDMSFFAS